MKKYVLLLIIGLYIGCTQQSSKQPRAAKADSLSLQLKEIREQYRPGLGEIMGGIQMHHAKLWYAAINDNWKLADYEIAEIKERLEEAAEIETNRPEVKEIPVMYPAIDNVASAIKQQNIETFKRSFQTLTNTCNSCHAANHFEFNVITIPTAPPVYNQDFKVHQ